MQYSNFDDYVAALSVESPQGLVLDWWCRLEREVRMLCMRLGLKHDISAARMITSLAKSGDIDAGLGEELNSLRRRRNEIAHGLELTALTAAEAESFARRSWHIGWRLGETVNIT